MRKLHNILQIEICNIYIFIFLHWLLYFSFNFHTEETLVNISKILNLESFLSIRTY